MATALTAARPRRPGRSRDARRRRAREGPRLRAREGSRLRARAALSRAGRGEQLPERRDFLRLHAPLPHERQHRVAQRRVQVAHVVAEVAPRLGAGKFRVGRQREQRIPRVQRRFAADAVEQLGKRRGEPRKPHGQHGGHAPVAGELVQAVEQLLHAHIPPGEDVALARPAVLGRLERALRHVAHVHKVVPALDARGQAAVQIALDHLGHVPLAVVVRADDAGRVDDDRVEPVARRVEHELRRPGLGLGVGALHAVGRKVRHFGHGHALRLLRDRVHGADVDELAHVVAAAQVDHVARAADVDLLHLFEMVRADVDEPGRVDEDDLRVVRHAVEQRLHRLHAAHVAAHDGQARAIEHGHVLALERQAAHLVAVREQQPRDVVADVAAEAREEKQPLHEFAPLL